MLGVFLAATFTITSAAFTDGGNIPSKFTCDAGQTSPSPALAWKDAPAGTKSFVLIMDDPDVPMPGGFTHWVLADVPAATKELPEGFQVGSVGVSANSGFRRPGYAALPKRVPPPVRGSALLRLDVCDLPRELGEQFPSTHP